MNTCHNTVTPPLPVRDYLPDNKSTVNQNVLVCTQAATTANTIKVTPSALKV